MCSRLNQGQFIRPVDLVPRCGSVTLTFESLLLGLLCQARRLTFLPLLTRDLLFGLSLVLGLDLTVDELSHAFFFARLLALFFQLEAMDLARCYSRVENESN